MLLDEKFFMSKMIASSVIFLSVYILRITAATEQLLKLRNNVWFKLKYNEAKELAGKHGPIKWTA